MASEERVESNTANDGEELKAAASSTESVNTRRCFVCLQTLETDEELSAHVVACARQQGMARRQEQQLLDPHNNSPKKTVSGAAEQSDKGEESVDQPTDDISVISSSHNPNNDLEANQSFSNTSNTNLSVSRLEQKRQEVRFSSQPGDTSFTSNDEWRNNMLQNVEELQKQNKDRLEKMAFVRSNSAMASPLDDRRLRAHLASPMKQYAKDDSCTVNSPQKPSDHTSSERRRRATEGSPHGRPRLTSPETRPAVRGVRFVRTEGTRTTIVRPTSGSPQRPSYQKTSTVITATPPGKSASASAAADPPTEAVRTSSSSFFDVHRARAASAAPRPSVKPLSTTRSTSVTDPLQNSSRRSASKPSREPAASPPRATKSTASRSKSVEKRPATRPSTGAERLTSTVPKRAETHTTATHAPPTSSTSRAKTATRTRESKVTPAVMPTTKPASSQPLGRVQTKPTVPGTVGSRQTATVMNSKVKVPLPAMTTVDLRSTRSPSQPGAGGGAGAAAAPESKTALVAFCTECGQKFQMEGKFCGKCGHRREHL